MRAAFGLLVSIPAGASVCSTYGTLADHRSAHPLARCPSRTPRFGYAGVPLDFGHMTVFADARLTRPLWPHQERALARVGLSRDATYLVVPPGGGKTLIGLEAARRIGRRTLVLCPNTAIQAHWLGQWRTDFATGGGDATINRDLRSEERRV